MNNFGKNFKVSCDKCNNTIVVDDESLWGQSVFCPNCQSVIYIPIPAQVEQRTLTHSSEDKRRGSDTKKCPYCKEIILKEAIKCKHCKEILNDEGRNKMSKSNLEKFAEGCQNTGGKMENLGCALTLLFTFPIVGLFLFGGLGLIIGIVIGLLGLMTISQTKK